jgi:hypothetical protein
MMAGVDRNFKIQGWRDGAKCKLVPKRGQQDGRATTCPKKVIAPSYDIRFQRSWSQIKATRVSYMMVRWTEISEFRAGETEQNVNLCLREGSKTVERRLVVKRS